MGRGEGDKAGEGSITVFLCMILAVIISVVTMTVESARWSFARLCLKQAAEYSLESVFADYYAPLFSEYGLTLLDATYGGEENAIVGQYEKYLSYNMNPSKGVLLSGYSNFYSSKVTDIKLGRVIYATEGGGEVIRRLTYEYMKYKLPADYVTSFLSQFDLIEQAKGVGEFLKKLDEIQDELDKVDKAIIEIKELADTIKEGQATLVELAEQLENAELTEEELKKAIEDFDVAKDVFGEIVTEALEATGIYEKVTTGIGEYLQKLSSDWLTSLEVPEMVENIIAQEISSLMVYSGGKGDIYGILANKTILEAMHAFTGMDIKEEGFDISAFTGYELVYNISSGEEAGTVDFSALYKQLKSDGIYPLVCPGYEKITSKTVVDFYNRTYAEGEGRKVKLPDSSLVDEIAETVCFSEYVGLKFTDYCNQQEDRPLHCEIEYIIGGNDSEKENVKDAINALLGIREVMNLLYLMTDTEKKAEAHNIALACVGASGMYGAVKVMEYLILTVWAFGEALIDVRILMEGGRVPLLKTSKEDWTLSLQGLLDIESMLIGVSGKPDGGIGDLDYNDYLKLVLYMQDKEEQALRVMDLIEADIQNRYYSKFYFNNCVYYVEVSGDFYLEPLFTTESLFSKKSELSCKRSY